MTQLKPGLKLKSTVCGAEVMVIKAGGVSTLSCGGAPMLEAGASATGNEPDPALMDGCQIGKRYVTEDEGLEVLCVKPGKGTLAADGQPLAIKSAKKLPSSD